MKLVTSAIVGLLLIGSVGCNKHNPKIIGLWTAYDTYGERNDNQRTTTVEFRKDGTMLEKVSIREGQKLIFLTKTAKYEDTETDITFKVTSYFASGTDIPRTDLIRENPKHFQNYFSVPYSHKTGILTLENPEGRKLAFRPVR